MLKKSTFKIFLSPNLAKWSYGWSLLQQHHKNEKENLEKNLILRY